jgi:hypothetical protein
VSLISTASLGFDTGYNVYISTIDSVLGAMYGWLVTDLAENGVRDPQAVYRYVNYTSKLNV